MLCVIASLLLRLLAGIEGTRPTEYRVVAVVAAGQGTADPDAAEGTAAETAELAAA